MTGNMPRRISHSLSILGVVAVALVSAIHASRWTAIAQDARVAARTNERRVALQKKDFKKQIQPLLKKFCWRCHNADKMTSGIRLDRLDGALLDKRLFLWKDILKQVEDAAMPPDDERHPTAEERRFLVDWIGKAMNAAKARNSQKNGSVRRLTVSQYRNTLRDLLGLKDDLTDVLPPDAVSKEGFLNNGQTMLLSPLLVEAYFDIAEKALDRCIVNENSKPLIQNFRMDFGTAVNPQPYPDKLILGASSRLLKNQDFVVTELKPMKPFDYEPFRMRTKYEFIEGYQGNDTVRGWRKYDSICHAVFACMRGTDGYPKGRAYQTIPEGLLLRPAIPSAELFQVESTYGPKANFKISLRELPDHGRFRVTVKAARYKDALLLHAGAPTLSEADAIAVTASDDTSFSDTEVTVKDEGIYQVDVSFQPSEKPGILSMTLGERHFSGQLFQSSPKAPESQTAFMLVRLPKGSLKMTVQYGDNTRLRRIVFTRLDGDSDAAQKFLIFEKRTPRVGVHVGLRRDCGSTLAQVGEPLTVSGNMLKTFVFEGAINNFPSPDVEKDNVNYLAGIREIGVRSEYTDGRDMPRLVIRSVEFEGPFYKTWPPRTHRRIFIGSEHKPDSPAYARDVIRSFATRAFRRPVTNAEAAALFAVWKNSFAGKGDFRQSIKDALLVVLTSPQFLFLIEDSDSPEPEALNSHELASKLSYFLWNTAPDRRLLELSAAETLHKSLDAEIERMIRDARFHQFANEFVAQWLSLNKFDVVNVDRKRFPKLTRDTKTQLRREPVELLQFLIQHNQPLKNLIQSDFIVANEVVASYYGLADRTERGFQFVAIKHQNKNLGGVLSQAGILAGLSDGRESNPVKRGAWLARKIIAEPPDDPPPNVPALPESDTKLTLREKLERHRNQKGCVKCHSGIDPWGIPFEEFDAGGLFKNDTVVDARSTLPDETEIANFNGLKAYLANDRIDQVAFSFLKHLSCYAIGRSLTYNEIEFLKEKGIELKADGYRMQDMVRFVIKSPLFLEK